MIYVCLSRLEYNAKIMHLAIQQKHVMPGLPLNERNFQTEVNGMVVWVIDDGVCFTLLYPEDY